MSLDAILESRLGLVEAPAGCGKTHLITDALAIRNDKPCLVLTHTTAGVAALKKRLRNTPSGNYRVATVAGWALNVAKMFPSISGYVPPANATPDYLVLQRAIAALCQRGDLSDIFQASYSRLFVDEYQDCSVSQHALICGLSQFLPTIIFGDPLQGVFGFGPDPLPSWEQEVQSFFPAIATLDTPWRWRNAGAPLLGQWILDVRQQLIRGNTVDLRSCPSNVSWFKLEGDDKQNIQAQIDAQYGIRRNITPDESLLVIGDSMNANSRHVFARNVNGLGVVEPVDLKDIVNAAWQFVNVKRENLLGEVLDMASTVMIGVDKAALLRRVQTISNGRNSVPPTPVEDAAITVMQEGNPSSILRLLRNLEQKEDSRVYRKGAFKVMIDALSLSVSNPNKSIYESASIIREQRRHWGDKRVPSRAIGSTLLLKGLEADHVLILNADSMNAKHLYVALSRGAKSISVFSTLPIVGSPQARRR